MNKIWPTKIERTNIFTGETTTLVFIQEKNGKGEYKNTETGQKVNGMPHGQVKQ